MVEPELALTDLNDDMASATTHLRYVSIHNYYKVDVVIRFWSSFLITFSY